MGGEEWGGVGRRETIIRIDCGGRGIHFQLNEIKKRFGGRKKEELGITDDAVRILR